MVQMFMIMQPPSNFSMTSANLQRSSTGPLKATRPAHNNLSNGKFVKASKSSGYGTSKPVHSMGSRALPSGPGPSPNRYTVEKLRYVSSSEQRTSLDNHVHRHKTTVDTPRTQRKSLNDSGYGSSLNVNSMNFRNGTLSERRSKSFTQLYGKDELDIRSPYYRTRTDPFSINGIIERNSLQSHNVNRNNNGNLSSLLPASSIHRSTTHTDYKNPKGVGKQEVKGLVKTSERDLADEGTPPGKNTHTIIEIDKTRKEIITALPNDLKMTRKSSYSSSNCSSTANSPTGRRNLDGLVGLRNLGNTCFMNSILQCLSHTWPLTDQLLKSSYLQNINIRSSMKGKLIQAFADLMKSMWRPGSFDSAVSPYSFKTQIQRFAPRFVGYSQQDAQEFLRFLLEGLHDDLNQVKDKQKYISSQYDDSLSDHQKAEKSWMRYLSRDKSLMTDLFVGQLKSMLKCCSCGYTSVTFDPFWDLSLPIPRKSSLSLSTSSPWAGGRRSSVYDDSDVNIIDCIQSFTKEEVLDGDERPTCDKCKVKTKATKKFSIQRFPSILVLHLKRFSGFSFRSKLQTNVEFPLAKLDLGEFAADPQECMSAVYSLYAVSNHSGTTYGGHYTAYCKHPISKEWHCFNDSRVDPLSSTRVGGAQAYILFYEKTERKSSL